MNSCNTFGRRLSKKEEQGNDRYGWSTYSYGRNGKLASILSYCVSQSVSGGVGGEEEEE